MNRFGFAERKPRLRIQQRASCARANFGLRDGLSEVGLADVLVVHRGLRIAAVTSPTRAIGVEAFFQFA